LGAAAERLLGCLPLAHGMANEFIAPSRANGSTAQEAANELAAAETERAALVGQIELPIIGDLGGPR
jgi:hypothetical protein